MELLENKTLEELLLGKNQEIIEQYYQELRNLSRNRIAKNIVKELFGYSLQDIWEKVAEEEQRAVSHSLFPNDLVLVYPSIKECRAKGIITCDFSGSLIHSGSLYVNYRPLIENITTNEAYVLKRTLKVESGYAHELPDTIVQLEELERKMQLGTNDDATGINYSHLNQVTGGELYLQKLKRRK